jgi:predicted nucleic acid-binding protein
MGKTPKRFVADTSFLVAVHNPHDKHHDAAEAFLKQMDPHPIQLIINPFIFAETVTVLAMRAHRELARVTGAFLLSDPQMLSVPCEERLSARTWEIFQEVTKKDTSFPDCSIVATLEQTATRDVLTFDQKDFRPLKRAYSFTIYPEVMAPQPGKERAA